MKDLQKEKNGDIKVSVTLKDGVISNLEVLETKEDKIFVYDRMK